MESKSGNGQPVMYNSDLCDIGALCDAYQARNDDAKYTAVMQRHTVLTAPEFKPTTEQVAALAEVIGKEPSAAMPGFTNDQVGTMQAYAANLRRKFPQMKAERLARKVREYFKLKLIK